MLILRLISSFSLSSSFFSLFVFLLASCGGYNSNDLNSIDSYSVNSINSNNYYNYEKYNLDNHHSINYNYAFNDLSTQTYNNHNTNILYQYAVSHSALPLSAPLSSVALAMNSYQAAIAGVLILSAGIIYFSVLSSKSANDFDENSNINVDKLLDNNHFFSDPQGQDPKDGDKFIVVFDHELSLSDSSRLNPNNTHSNNANIVKIDPENKPHQPPFVIDNFSSLKKQEKKLQNELERALQEDETLKRISDLSIKLYAFKNNISVNEVPDRVRLSIGMEIMSNSLDQLSNLSQERVLAYVDNLENQLDHLKRDNISSKQIKNSSYEKLFKKLLFVLKACSIALLCVMFF